MESLKAKIHIKGILEVLTGLRIGGSSSTIEIGGLDNNVIKTHDGVPYIPGSTLKGKLRTLLGIKDGKTSPREDEEAVRRIFGDAPDNETEEGNGSKPYYRSRLICRDAFWSDQSDDFLRNSDLMETDYTEVKWENTIDRATSRANPRQMERVPKGAKFEVGFVYDVYDEDDVNNLKVLLQAFNLLEDDYLGGSGTRGYGRIKFDKLQYSVREISEYVEGVFKGDPKDFDFAAINDLKEMVWLNTK